MKKYLLLFCLLLASARADDPHLLLAGTWHFDPARSTELSPWKNYELTISLRDSVEVVPLDVLLKLAAGAKTYRTRFQLPSDPVGRNP